MKIETFQKITLSLILLLFLYGAFFLGNEYIRINHKHEFKAVVIDKSINTLNYNCGYKGKYVCRGVFNQVFYNSQYGQFSESVDDCSYNGLKIGDTVTIRGDEVQLWLWYNIHVN